MKKLDVAAFALPNCPPDELWFEEPRDVETLVVELRKPARGRLGLSYRRNKWPEMMWAQDDPDLRDPARFGWQPTDDWWNGAWQRAAITETRVKSSVEISFRPLRTEGFRDLSPERNVSYRRTLALRIEGVDPADVRRVRCYTRSQPSRALLTVQLDAGRATRTRRVALTGYNCLVEKITPPTGATVAGGVVTFRAGKTRPGSRCVRVAVAHLSQPHRHANDTGLLTLTLDGDVFTVAVDDVRRRGVWYAEQGVYCHGEEAPDFETYRAAVTGKKTITQLVSAHAEQSFAGAVYGMPRPHAVHTHTGVKHARQRFMVEANGDLVLPRSSVASLDGVSASAARYAADGDSRYFFGLERHLMAARYTDASPAPIATLMARRGEIRVVEQCLAVPITRALADPQASSDEPVAALVRFRFTNEGEREEEARLAVAYSTSSRRSENQLLARNNQDDYLVPGSERSRLTLSGDTVTSDYRGAEVVRLVLGPTAMKASAEGGGVLFRRRLGPGESCELELRVPFLAPQAAELGVLRGKVFDTSLAEARSFWRAECSRGSAIRTPVPHLDGLYRNHLMHVEVSDFPMPGDPKVINTSVGTSTYGNFSNESCMIVQELIQRGLHEEARRRIDLWVKYQGTVPQPGNFTDYEGMYFGAGGFEQGDYNQHHGWVLWIIAEYWFLTRDDAWLRSVAPSLAAGCDWVYRQRKGTLGDLPHSRGWEKGFLPAGSLEDVVEFCYWLSTNSLTWRGTDAASRALAEIGYRDAPRLVQESKAFGQDLRRGFDQARRATPLVPLRDGRWVPTFPSRLYRRGREYGWIRELLEGSVYLLISGLYGSRSREASWILDDYQDNRYLEPPYGYALRDVPGMYFQRGGFSIQPCLLAGLMPHLERDEPEVAIWMYFNSLAACYREEMEGLSEHPLPELGFSNSAQWKTSDEANTVMWLRALLLYGDGETVHVGRAVPRSWMAEEGGVELTGVSTYHGIVDLRYDTRPADGGISCWVRFRPHAGAKPRLLVRFRHPTRAPLTRVLVNGKTWEGFDSRTEDVDLTGLTGEIRVQAFFGEEPPRS